MFIPLSAPMLLMGQDVNNNDRQEKERIFVLGMNCPFKRHCDFCLFSLCFLGLLWECTDILANTWLQH